MLLTCTVNNSLEDGPITWTHNKTTLPKTTSSWDIIDAKAEDSGQYRCKSQKRTISEPVYLEVISGKFQGYMEILFLSCEEWPV